jgi:hypothetical protein
MARNSGNAENALHRAVLGASEPGPESDSFEPSLHHAIGGRRFG